MNRVTFLIEDWAGADREKREIRKQSLKKKVLLFCSLHSLLSAPSSLLFSVRFPCGLSMPWSSVTCVSLVFLLSVMDTGCDPDSSHLSSSSSSLEWNVYVNEWIFAYNEPTHVPLSFSITWWRHPWSRNEPSRVENDQTAHQPLQQQWKQWIPQQISCRPLQQEPHQCLVTQYSHPFQFKKQEKELQAQKYLCLQRRWGLERFRWWSGRGRTISLK